MSASSGSVQSISTTWTAMISAFARYANGIKGSDAFMPEDMKTAPEIVVPAEFADKGVFSLTCPPEVQELYTRIWTDLQK